MKKRKAEVMSGEPRVLTVPEIMDDISRLQALVVAGGPGLASLNPLLEHAHSDDVKVRSTALGALCAVFRPLLDQGEVKRGRDAAADADEATVQIDRFVCDAYAALVDRLVSLLWSEADVAVALNLLMSLLAAESPAPWRLGSGPMGAGTMMVLLKALVQDHDEEDHARLVVALRRLLREHIDLRVCLYAVIGELGKEGAGDAGDAGGKGDQDSRGSGKDKGQGKQKQQKRKSRQGEDADADADPDQEQEQERGRGLNGEGGIRTILSLVLGLPWEAGAACLGRGGEPTEKDAKRAFSRCWECLLAHSLPDDLYKSVLLRLSEDILPHLNRPLGLMEFLSVSYGQGGVVSVLALSGLFDMITDYGLDYPSFYEKTYALLDATVLLAKHRVRFLRLLAAALQSPYLPDYLVAAFAKRLARLSIAATPSGALCCMGLICNLLVRHPEAQTLLHREASGDDAAAQGIDPYDGDAADPKLSRALESSLWELKSLKRHYEPEVSKFAHRFDNELKTPCDLDLMFGETYASLFDRAAGKEEAAAAAASDKAGNSSAKNAKNAKNAGDAKGKKKPPAVEVKPRAVFAPEAPAGEEAPADTFNTNRSIARFFVVG